ncbi:MAG: hypothetical protein ACYC4S_19850 [Rhodoferax sp.]
MSAIDVKLYFTFQEGCDVGSGVVVDTATGEFDEEQAFSDMCSLTENDPIPPEGQYLQVGGCRFEVERVKAEGWKWRVADLEGFQRVIAEIRVYPEFELVDVLKHRVAEGHPIHVTGQPSKEVMSVIESVAQGIAEETGQPVRIVQHIQLP